MSLLRFLYWCKVNLNGSIRQQSLLFARHKCKQLVFYRPICFTGVCTSLLYRNYSTMGNKVKKTVEKQEVIRILLYHGFNEDDATHLLKQCPQVVNLSEENVMQNLQCWDQFQFGESQLISLLLKHPNLLLVNINQLKNVYKYLISLYNTNGVYKIFLNSPNIVIDNTDRIEEKVAYLQTEMSVPKSQILNSSALGYPLHYIKERHEFLKRVGVYKVADKNNIEHVNPSLDRIVSSLDKDFAIKVAGVSLEEYEVFQQMFLLEQENNE